MLIFPLSLPEAALCRRDTLRLPTFGVAIIAETIACLEPDVLTHRVQTGMASQATLPLPARKKRARPKSNRMPDAAHSVKVEAQVVNCVEDLGKYLVGRIKMPQVGA
jgi:hypothetical protein